MSNYSSTAAERPQQLPEQLGTAQCGGRGAREPSWKVVLGLNPPTPTFLGCGTLVWSLSTSAHLSPTALIPRNLSSA